MRIATFNIENLFSRARILNFQNNSYISGQLNKVTKLIGLLKERNYDAEKIINLTNELKEFIEIKENRGKLFKKKLNKIIGLSAMSPNDWDGFITFKREEFSELTRSNSAKVIQTMNADIQCLVEVENRDTLSAFNQSLLQKSKYLFNMLIDGNDDRGIDVGILSRVPFCNIQTHIFDKIKGKTVFSRDCLVVQFVFNNKPLYVLVNHLKSQGYGNKTDNDRKRKMQATRIAEILKTDFNLKKDLVVVTGDFNDVPESDSLKPLLSKNNMYDVLRLKFGADMKCRWTYSYQSSKNQIDYLLISAALKKHWKDAGIERKGIFDLHKLTKGKISSFPTVTKPSNAASDHAGVWADFDL